MHEDQQLIRLGLLLCICLTRLLLNAFSPHWKSLNPQRSSLLNNYSIAAPQQFRLQNMFKESNGKKGRTKQRYR